MSKAIWPERNDAWGVGASHGGYHRDGKWYSRLKGFPGAYFDLNGSVLFETEVEYRQCDGSHGMRIGPHPDHVNFRNGIAALPGYVKKPGYVKMKE